MKGDAIKYKILRRIGETSNHKNTNLRNEADSQFSSLVLQQKSLNLIKARSTIEDVRPF